MKVLQTLIGVSGGLVVLVGAMGCEIFAEHSRRETVYVAQPEPAYVIVREAPPPIIVERRSPMPGPGYFWIDGYWHWDGHRYGWQGGRWAVPPHERAVWVAPRYEKHEQGYRYVPGQWREEQRQREDEPRRDRR